MVINIDIYGIKMPDVTRVSFFRGNGAVALELSIRSDHSWDRN